MTNEQLQEYAARLDASGVSMAQMVLDPDYVGQRTILMRIPWEDVLVRCMALGWTPCLEAEQEETPTPVLKLEP